MAIPFYDAQAVERHLDYPGCTLAMREAMIALSTGQRDQPLRQIVPLKEGAVLGVMPGDLSTLGLFGAKLVSVFREGAGSGHSRHRGVVVAFDLRDGTVTCLADAEAVTTIRTACATAAATDALARAGSKVLAILGTGTQAASHLRAVTAVRSFRDVLVWGRDHGATAAFADRMSAELKRPVLAVSTAREAAADADVICTVTGAREPILRGAWLRPGTHVNLVGSSVLGPVEVDTDLVALSRYVADYRAGALAQASELSVAMKAGAVGPEHVVAEIGEVFAGVADGRRSDTEITVYKSLGHVVQDLAAAAYVHQRAS